MVAGNTHQVKKVKFMDTGLPSHILGHYADDFKTQDSPPRKLELATVQLPCLIEDSEYILGRYMYTYPVFVGFSKVIDIPYKNGFKMTVIMPENLEQFESCLTTEQLQEFFSKTTVSKSIMLTMPRFNMEVQYDLKKEPLKFFGFSLVKLRFKISIS